jgi:hypothetical protein
LHLFRKIRLHSGADLPVLHPVECAIPQCGKEIRAKGNVPRKLFPVCPEPRKHFLYEIFGVVTGHYERDPEPHERVEVLDHDLPQRFRIACLKPARDVIIV